MAAKKGDKVKVEYTGTLEDGTVFDSCEGKEPIEFELGSGKVIKGFEDAVVGMEKGQEKELELEPADAYGDPNPQMVKEVPRDKLPQDKEPKEGMMLLLSTQDGRQIPGKIVEVTEQAVKLDLNHPLAGKKLKFRIKLVDIVSE